MHTLDNVRFALRSLRDNKMRTALTTLGVVIGVAAVVGAIGIGQSAFAQVLDTVGALGSNLLVIIPGNPQMRFGPGSFSGSVTSLTLDDSRAILEHNKGLVVRTAPSVGKPTQVTYRNKKWLTRVSGVVPDEEQVGNRKVTHGRFITLADDDSRARVALLGLTVIQNLFGSADAVPLGEEVEINRVRFRVVGVLEKKGAAFGSDQDDVVMVPLQTAMRRVLNQNYVNFMELECSSKDSMDLAAERVGALLRRRHRLRPPFPDNDDFAIRSQASLLQTIQMISGILSGVLGGIAGISLTVGGIGIMNIMLVSVTERTREIGIRKALGATQRLIMQQFLVESALISMLGGLLGILFGIGLVFGASKALSWTPVVDPRSVVLAVGVSAAIGIFFGLWPAKKAARLNPIEALRRE
jgi:putative ABC transport system permease protein